MSMERTTYYCECPECEAQLWPTGAEVRPDQRRVVCWLECVRCDYVVELRLLIRAPEERAYEAAT